MPTAKSGYELIAQQDEDHSNSSIQPGQIGGITTTPIKTQPGANRNAPIDMSTPTSTRKRQESKLSIQRGRSNSTGIDIKAINARLER